MSKHRRMRRRCNCFEMRDIGAYDTCPNGCRYCYANQSPGHARENFRLHDPAAPMLIGGLGPGDELTQGRQKSLLAAPQLCFDLWGGVARRRGPVRLRERHEPAHPRAVTDG